nr:MAG TPA: hypothetical protein [Caudoviricetes sp.]
MLKTLWKTCFICQRSEPQNKNRVQKMHCIFEIGCKICTE